MPREQAGVKDIAWPHGCDLLVDEARYGEDGRSDALDRRVHWLLPTQGYLQHNCRT